MIRLKVKEVAQARGVSQRQLFLITGIDLKHIQRLFRDPTRNTTTYTLNKIAKALNITDIADLLEIVPDE